MTVRRVTSAKGWGEVRTHAHTTTKYNAIYKAQIQPIEAFLEDALGILAHLHVYTHLLYVHSSLQVEFGAGDILGPLIGLKVFRNVTPRW